MNQSPERKIRIFISYSSRDQLLAEKVQKELDAAGFNVWRDKTRLETDWSHEIAMALARSDVLCLIWTENATQSKWVKHEWLTARALEKPIVPCFSSDAPVLPTPLSNIQGVELPDDNNDYSSIVQRLRRVLSFTVQYDYTVLPPNSYLPFNPNPNFTGRHLDLLDLYLKLIGNLNKIGVNHVGCVGMAGVGKTQLVVEFAYRFSFAFEGIYLLQAVDQEAWSKQCVRIAKYYLKLQGPEPESSEADQYYLLAFQKYCREHPHLLMIMDNVIDPLMLNSDSVLSAQINLTPLTLGCDILFTTRKRFHLPGVNLQPVGPLSQEAAYHLLTRDRQLQSPAEQERAREICNAIGYLPLALTLIAGYLGRYRSISFADYHYELLKNKIGTLDLNEISSAELATRHETAVAVTLNSQWAMLTDEYAKHLFLLSSLFPETTIIAKARLSLLSGIGPGKSKLDQPVERAFLLLQDLSLVEVAENGLSIR